AFTGLELVSAMSQEIHNPRRTLPRAALTAAALIAGMYIVGTLALLSLVPAAQVDPKSGVFHGITVGSAALHAGFIGILAALLVTVGNAGGVGSTVAGIARVPFVVGIDRYLPAAFGKIHPKWKTPYISIIVQAIASGLVLLLSQINETTRGAYQVVIDITIIIYFIPFLYMFAAAVTLASRLDVAAGRFRRSRTLHRQGRGLQHHRYRPRLDPLLSRRPLQAASRCRARASPVAAARQSSQRFSART